MLVCDRASRDDVLNANERGPATGAEIGDPAPAVVQSLEEDQVLDRAARRDAFVNHARKFDGVRAVGGSIFSCNNHFRREFINPSVAENYQEVI